MMQLKRLMACLMLAGLFGNCKHSENGPADPPAPPDFTVNTRQVITADFIGMGTQYNQNLYTAISRSDGITLAKVKRVGSQHVRIFFDARSFDTLDYSDYMRSFIRTVQLEQVSESSVNIAYPRGPYTDIGEQMSSFADVLGDLIVTRGLTAVKYVTARNEVNSMATCRQLYTELAADLKKLGIRKSVGLIGGDLVRTNQQAWFTYMADNMSGILDGHSTHIYGGNHLRSGRHGFVSGRWPKLCIFKAML